MKNENQHIEWKESWWDQCLKWISGFKNAESSMPVNFYVMQANKGHWAVLP
jgi:hypothetical protein